MNTYRGEALLEYLCVVDVRELLGLAPPHLFHLLPGQNLLGPPAGLHATTGVKNQKILE
jgi:hypothetical protein